MPSPLRSIPLVSWARRFDHGTVELSGRLTEALSLPVEPERMLPPGQVTAWFSFRGGARPGVAELRIASEGTALAPMGSKSVAEDAPGVLESLVDALHDPAIRVVAHPGEDLLLRLAPGVSATLPPQSPVVVEATARGTPERPRLVKPLVASVGGAGLSILLPGSRWVRRLASVRIRRASLAPDGHVELTSLEETMLELAVGAGLRHASSHLSELVRNSPRLRPFLED